MQHPSSFRHAQRCNLSWGALGLCLATLSVGCADDAGAPTERVSQARSALSKPQSDVLGFEVLGGWNVSQGSKALSPTHSEGQQSLAVTASGWTEVESIALTSLGTTPDVAQVDVRLPTNQVNPWWYGAVQFYVGLPSQHINNLFIGQVELTGKAVDQFLTLSFPLPANLKTALGTTYSDLRLKVVLNVPSGNGAYLLDNLQLGQGAAEQPAAKTCDPYQRVGTNGDVRFQFTTLASDTMVRLKAKKNGLIYLDRLLTPSGPSLPGIAAYTFVDDASNYHDGDVIASQFSFDRAAPHCAVDTRSPWAVGSAYAVGARVSYQGQVYEARQAHTAQADWPPSTTLTLWQIPNDCRVSSWLANTAYKIGDRVAYQDKQYEALQAHTSQGDWQPPNVPALWRVTSLAPNPPSGSGAVTIYKPGPSENDWAEQRYGATRGCTPVPDRDGDGVPDIKDLCPDDPHKGEKLGACACGVAETDSDGDGLADCKDRCPQDKRRFEPGDCGCGNEPAPQGQFCDDGGAAGAFKCDGGGQCGPSDGGRPSFARGVCATISYRDSIYITCSSDKVSWNDAARLAPAGYQIARVDSEEENQVVTSLVAGAGAQSAWLDGLVTKAGVVSHSEDGKPTDVMWDESRAPKNPGLRFFAWQPTPTTGSGCQSLAANGSWQVSGCAELRPVVYERSSRTLSVLTTPTPITAADFPGLIGEPNREPGSELCVDHGADYEKCRTCLLDHAADTTDGTPAQIACNDECAVGRCFDCLEDKKNPDLCTDKCTSCELCQAKQEADPSLDCEGACATSETAPCTARFGAVCEVTVPDPSSAVACVRQACPAAQPDCAAPYECADGSRCGVLKLCGDCGKDKPCPAECTKLVCGGTLVNPDCGLDLSEPAQTCREELACNSDFEVAGSGTLKDEMLPITLPALPVVSDPPPQQPASKTGKFPSADEEAAGSSTAEAWCHYRSESPQTKPKISDGKAGAAGEKGRKALQFNLDPNVTLEYSLEALPLGQIKFEIDAEARLLATAQVNFAGIDSKFTVLDARLAASVDRCGYGMDGSYIELFDDNFLPPLLAEAKLSGLLESHRVTNCKEALEAYQEVADRAKKAMRDAQELLRQYHAALREGACLNLEELCSKLMDNAPTGFVGIDCSTDKLKVEDIVNLFIFNYERLLIGSFDLPKLPSGALPKVSLPDFPDVRLESKDFNPGDVSFGDFYKLGGLPSLSEAGKALGGFKPDTGKLNPQWADTYGCGPGAKTELSTLFTKPFMLGPIPMLLEVQSVIKYGLSGKLDFAFHPDRLVALALGSGADVEVASVTANATPCVSAGLGLFVGAGFKGYGFRATAGVEGVVNLGTISAPAQATAAIHMSAEDEAIGLTARPTTVSGPNAAPTTFRELPDDLKGLWDGKELPIKQRRFNVSLDYKYGLSVGIDQVLAGHLKASLQIKFLFFKKRWSKYLVNFGNGFSLGHYRLIGGKGDVALHAQVPWATLQMPSPFVNFRYLEPLAEGLIGAEVEDLPRFDIPVAQLGSLGWDSDRFKNITLSLEDLSALGGLSAGLQAKGVDISKLQLSDLSVLGITLDKLAGVPLLLGDLDALELSAAELALLGIELPLLAPERLGLRGFSLAHVGALDLPSDRLSKVQVDWRDLPELSYRLRRPELAQALRNAGVDLTNLTLVDFFKLSGLTIDSFRAWPLTPQHVTALGLTTSDMQKMGIDLTGLDLRIDGDPAAFEGRGLDLSGLSLASLAVLGLGLDDLAGVAVDAARLLELNTALGYSDIRTALAAVGVTDFEHIKLSDLGKLEAGLDGVKSKLSSSALGLGVSDLVKLGFGDELAKLDLGSICEKRPLDTQRVGQFFYERQCQCRALFNESLPYTQGEQSCSVDADCCTSAPYCSSTVKQGFKVCSTTPSSQCGTQQDFTVKVEDTGRIVDFQGEIMDRIISQDFGDKPPICKYEVFLESRDGKVGTFDDRGAVRFPGADVAAKQITNEPNCFGGVLGTISGRVNVTDYVRKTGNKLELELEAQDKCGTNVGWSGLQLTYEMQFAE